MTRLRFLFPVLLAALFLSGCGYHLGAIKPTPMRNVRTLAVQNFKNRTYEADVETLLADTLIKQVQLDGTYTVASDQTADAIVHCTLEQLQRTPIQSTVGNVLSTSEFEIDLKVSYFVEDRVTGAVLMRGQAFGKSTFFTTSDLTTVERQAIPEAAENLAKDITQQLSEGW
jgi:outer membrane lipopolysaccharide assembly protein LptE/RlpB